MTLSTSTPNPALSGTAFAITVRSQLSESSPTQARTPTDRHHQETKSTSATTWATPNKPSNPPTSSAPTVPSLPSLSPPPTNAHPTAWLRAGGGIHGRGILVDYARFAAANGIAIDPFSSQPIPLAHVEQILRETHTVPRRGDILLLRTGTDAALKALSPAAQQALAARPEPNFVGLEATRATLRWLWAAGFAAAASDAPSFERGPVMGAHHDPAHVLHQWLLAGWGMPIGELFDLEGVAAECERQGRWAFWFGSVVLNVGFLFFFFPFLSVMMCLC